MSEKDMSAKLVKEPLTKMVKEAGSCHEEIVEEPTGDIIDQLADGVENLPESTLSGFGKQSSPVNKQTRPAEIKQGATGFATFTDTRGHEEDIGYIEDPDDVIADAITASKTNADKVYKTAVQEELHLVEAFYKDLPKGWRGIQAIRRSIVSVIAENVGVSKDVVDQLL